MDPVSLILSALAAGAATSVQATASDAIKDAYSGLKALIQQKFAGKRKAEAALVDYEDDPETYELPLKKVLLQERLDQDEKIIQAAQQLMTLIQPQQVAKGKYNTQITHSRNFIVGDHANQTIYTGKQIEEQ